MQVPQGQIIGGDYVISFTEPYGVSGITYGADWTPTLSPPNWLPVTDTGSDGTHTFSVPTTDKPTMFLRLTVKEP